MTYWPWWLGALALGGVAVGMWLSTGRLLGVSGSFASVLFWREQRRAERASDALAADEDAAAAALLAATREQFGEALAGAVAGGDTAPASAPASPDHAASGDADRAGPLPVGAQAALLGGVLGGAFLSSLLARGAAGPVLTLGADFDRFVGAGPRGMVGLVVGGVLVGFGTAMSGGCTSGHGLCGTSRLQPGSLLATSAFFGAGVLVSFALGALAR